MAGRTGSGQTPCLDVLLSIPHIIPRALMSHGTVNFSCTARSCNVWLRIFGSYSSTQPSHFSQFSLRKEVLWAICFPWDEKGTYIIHFHKDFLFPLGLSPLGSRAINYFHRFFLFVTRMLCQVCSDVFSGQHSCSWKLILFLSEIKTWLCENFCV